MTSLSAHAHLVGSRRIAEESTQAVERLRRTSKEILNNTSAIGGAVGKAGIDAVKVIWQSVMNILRFLSRIFGVKFRGPALGDSAEKQGLAEDAASHAGGAALRPAAASMLAQEIQTSEDVDKTANEALKIIESAKALPTAHAAGFLRALEFAGLQDADLALLDHARNPASMRSETVSHTLLENSLQRVAAALANLDNLAFAAHAERAQAAQAFSGRYEPPMLTEDLVSIQRNALEKGLVPESDVPAVRHLLSSHDAIALVEAHRQTIIGSTMLVVAQAVRANVSLEPFEEKIAKIGGGDWANKLHTAVEELNYVVVQTDASALPVPALDVSADLAGLDRVDAEIANNTLSAAEATRAATNFLSQQTLGGAAASSEDAGQTVPAKSASFRAAQARVAAAIKSSQHDPLIDDRFGDDFHDKPVN